MASLIDGLQGYEVVMLGLGVVLFVVLIFALLYQLLHGKSFVMLLAFFILPIVMIGYPSIQKIQIDGKTVTIEKTTKELQAKPADPALRHQLQQDVAQIQEKSFSSANTLTVLAKAQYALGDEKGAASNLQKAFQADPNATGAHDLKNKIDLVKNVARLASKLDSNPADANAESELKKTLAAATQLPIANPKALTQIAKAQTLTGEHRRAIETASKVVAISPDAPATLELKELMKKRVPSPAEPKASRL